MGQHGKLFTIQPPDDVARTPQAAPDRLTDPAQAGIGGVPAEYVDVGVEFVEREQDDRERTFLASRDGPVMVEHFAEYAIIEKPGHWIVP